MDIGPKIGIDGEAEFRKQLGNINQQLKTLGSEMKAVTSAFDAGDRSEAALGAQSEVLNRQIEAQEQKLAQLRKGLDAAAEKYGENDSRTLRWAQAVNDATADLNKMKSALSKTEVDMDDLSDTTEQAGEAAERTGGKFGGMTVALGNLVSSGIQAAASAIGNAVKSLFSLDEATEEYRVAQGKLNTAFEAAGYSTDQAGKAYTDFYKILGDTDTATEASQLLAKLSLSSEDMSKWTNVAAGVWGTFGDSLPIEGLIESANETAKVGKVTGSLADALNWAGISEDTFNKQLEAAGSEAGRNQLIMNTLSQTYDGAAEAFWQNNEALVQARENQALMDASLSGLGETISSVKTQLSSELFPALTQLIDAFNGILTGAPGAGDAMAQAVGQIVSTVAEKLPEFLSTGAQIVSALLSGIAQSLPEIGAAGAEVVGGLISSVKEKTPEMIQQGGQVLLEMTQGFSQQLPAWIAAAGDALAAFFQFLGDNAPALIEQGANVLGELALGIINAIPGLVAQLPKIISEIVSFLLSSLPQIAESGARLLAELAIGIVGNIPELLSSVLKVRVAILDGLKALIGEIPDIGKNIVEGLWEGITGSAAWLTGKLKEWCGSVLDGVKSFFGIHSPSTVMRDKVGVMLAEGVAVGLKKGIKSVQRTAGQVGDAIVDEINAVNAELERMTQEESERKAQQELAAYEKSVKEKYAQLGKAEKEERQAILDDIAALEADWNEKQAEAARTAEREAAEGRLKVLEEFQKEYQSRLDEINQEYENNLDDLLDKSASMAEKLSDYGDLFTMADDVLTLGDLQSDIDQIRAYGDALAALEERGIPEDLMAGITDLDVDDALAYANELLSMTDEAYQEYMDLWKQKQEEAAKVASQFYENDLAALRKEYVDQIPQELKGLKDEMEDLGINSAQGISDGFSSMAGELQNGFISTLSSALAAAKDFLGIHSPSTVFRDEVGRFMAQGIGVGFQREMAGVAAQMQRSIPVPSVRFGGQMDRSGASYGAQPSIPASYTFYLTTELDGTTLARKQYQFNAREASLRGPSLVEVPTG